MNDNETCRRQFDLYTVRMCLKVKKQEQQKEKVATYPVWKVDTLLDDGPGVRLFQQYYCHKIVGVDNEHGIL